MVWNLQAIGNPESCKVSSFPQSSIALNRLKIFILKEELLVREISRIWGFQKVYNLLCADTHFLDRASQPKVRRRGGLKAI